MVPHGSFRVVTIDNDTYVFGPQWTDGTRRMWFNSQEFGFVRILGSGIKHSGSQDLSYPGDLMPEYQMFLEVQREAKPVLWVSGLVVQIIEAQVAEN